MTWRKGMFTIRRVPRDGDSAICQICSKRALLSEMLLMWGVVIISAVCHQCAKEDA